MLAQIHVLGSVLVIVQRDAILNAKDRVMDVLDRAHLARAIALQRVQYLVVPIARQTVVQDVHTHVLALILVESLETHNLKGSHKMILFICPPPAKNLT